MTLFKLKAKKDTFWREFLGQTEDFKKPFLLKNQLQADFDYNAVFKKFFYKYSTDTSFRANVKIRAYIENVQDESAIEEIQNNPPEESQSIHEWGEALFKGKPWCIILDKVSGMIDDIVIPISQWIQPLVNSFPAGEVKVDISPYIGRYGFTPFGAHIDVDGIKVIHLQMGPNAKEMTLWEADRFKQLNQSDEAVCFDYLPYLFQGKTYYIEAGDIFHLPASTYYHVGNASHFSFGITVGIKKESSKTILSKALKEFEKDPTDQDKSDLVESYRFKCKSNLGFMKKPMLKNATTAELMGKKVTLNLPFKIIIREKNNYHLLYVRGRVLKMESKNEVLKLIQKLNQNQTIHLSPEFCEKNDVTFNSLLELICKLYNYGALLIED
ncbi:MAG: hypothetical protein RIC95_13605 [Vicingaceae bacterium]